MNRDKVTAERVTMLAAAARVPIPDTSPARIAKAVSPVVERMAAKNLQLQLEIEPATFIAIARGGVKR